MNTSSFQNDEDTFFLFKKKKTTLYAPIKQSIAIDLVVINFCGPRKVLPSDLLPKANERHD